MLREVKNAGWARQGAWIFKRHVFVVGKVRAAKAVKPAELAAMDEAQRDGAVHVLVDGARSYWWCLGRYYWEDEQLSAEDVHALAFERRLRADRKLKRARTTVATAELPSGRRDAVPVELRHAVWARDGGRCVSCGADFDLQFDHVIPVAMGGATSERNLQLLCAPCNREKGASLG